MTEARRLNFDRLFAVISEEKYLCQSPFYRNEKAIANQVNFLMRSNKHAKAFDLLKKVVSNEKKWRFSMCKNLFGIQSCKKHGDVIEPFFMWKKNVVDDLLKDPTYEIVKKIRSHIKKK